MLVCGFIVKWRAQQLKLGLACNTESSGYPGGYGLLPTYMQYLLTNQLFILK